MEIIKIIFLNITKTLYNYIIARYNEDNEIKLHN